MTKQPLYKKVPELSQKEIETCLALTYGDEHGSMGPALKKAHRKNDQNSIVILLKEQEELIAWAFVSTTSGISYFYVHHQHRRKGLGGFLVKEAKQILGKNPVACPHDYCSGQFFKSVVSDIKLNSRRNRRWMYGKQSFVDGDWVKLYFVDNHGKEQALFDGESVEIVSFGNKQITVVDPNNRTRFFWRWHYKTGKQKIKIEFCTKKNIIAS